MDLAGHTYAFRDRPLEHALDELQELGYDVVEVWLGHATATPEAVARMLERRGQRVAAVSAGGFYPEDPSAPARAYALAAALGTNLVVATVSPQLLSGVARGVPEGVTLCLENHWDQAFAQPSQVLRALEAEPSLAACLDTGHALMAGARPDRFALRLGNRLRHIHLKDSRRATPAERALGRRLRLRLLGRPAPVFPGDGALRTDSLRQALETIEFKGSVSAEFEGNGTRAASALAELRRRWPSLAQPDRAPVTPGTQR